MKPTLSAIAILLLAAAPALAHRLDEYLQGTIVSVGKNRVDAQITLTPGVSVFPTLIADIDTDANGVISAAEQHAYADRILRDLSLKIDGQPLTPQLLSVQFPAIDEMKEGRGEIQLEFAADLPPGGSSRKLMIENRHESRIAAYQVNCLVPSDPGIRIVAQHRNYSQSHYELDYVQTGVRAAPIAFSWPGAPKWLGTGALLLSAWLAVLWMQRASREASRLRSENRRPRRVHWESLQ
jgi:hypothetical protein